MSVLEGKIQTSDGIDLYTRDWLIDNPKAVLVFVHGFGEHIQRYNHVADFFNKNGIACYGYDRRGHGKSGGKRGHTPSHDALLDEMDLIIDKARNSYPSLPLVLYGHSQGGHLGLFHLIKRDKGITASVITSPWIQLGFQPPVWKVRIGRFLSKFAPALGMPNELNHSDLSRDQSIVSTYASDPLNVYQITTGCGAIMLDAADWLNEYSGNISVPVMINHGTDDKVISPTATQAFVQRMTGDITLKMWEGGYHELHNEINRDEVMDEILNWLKSKIEL